MILRSISRARLQPILIAAVAAFVPVVSGCSDDDERASKPAAATTASEEGHGAKWLDQSNPLTPAQWVASRNHPEVKAVDDPDVKRIAANLSSAHKVYRETERMIANRAVQLEDMLREVGVDEDAASVIEDLAQVPGEAGQTEGFGAVSQHYFNLRTAKLERSAALAALKQRYGPRQ